MFASRSARRLCVRAMLAVALLSLGPSSAGADSSGYSCTEVIGYSQTRQWYFGGFASAVDTSAWQLRARDAAAVEFWADPGFAGWDPSNVLTRCAQNSGRPDRVVLDVTNDYQTDVGWWTDQISTAVATIRRKYPGVRQIVLEPVVGGAGGGQCQFNGKVVRASFNHPYINQAIANVADADVVVGAAPRVRTCGDYADDIGHLAGDAPVAVGRSIAEFYASTPTTTTTSTTSSDAPAPPTEEGDGEP
jgi:hypothetical protein